MPPLLKLQKLPGKGEGGWRKKKEKSVFVLFFGLPEDREFAGEKKKLKKKIGGHPIARATSYCLLPDTF